MVAIRLTVLLVLVAAGACTSAESPGDKHEWSILQSAEHETRAQRTDRVLWRTDAGYELMGVPRHGDGRVVWVMLKPVHGARYKQMPEGNFSIDRDTLLELGQGQRVTETVAEALKSHLSHAEEAEKSATALPNNGMQLTSGAARRASRALH